MVLIKKTRVSAFDESLPEEKAEEQNEKEEEEEGHLSVIKPCFIASEWKTTAISKTEKWTDF